MLNRTWKIILLVVALLLAVWPGLLGESASQWIGVIALVVLLIAEFMCPSGSKSRRKEADASTMVRERTTSPTRTRATSRRRRR